MQAHVSVKAPWTGRQPGFSVMNRFYEAAMVLLPRFLLMLVSVSQYSLNFL